MKHDFGWKRCAPVAELGRRRGFKIPRREACRFESGLGYHLLLLRRQKAG